MHTDNFSTARCRAALGPMSAAVRAEHALRREGSAAEVVALEPHETRRGCAFGVEFFCSDESPARSVLRAARITVSQYFKKG